MENESRIAKKLLSFLFSFLTITDKKVYILKKMPLSGVKMETYPPTRDTSLRDPSATIVLKREESSVLFLLGGQTILVTYNYF